MTTEVELLPLKFEKAFRYVTGQLRDGHALAQALLKNVDFKEGHFFALLHRSADKTQIHEFQAGGILPTNLLEPVIFQGNIYPGREKSHSVHQLVLYLKSVLRPGQSCFFEDLIHSKSDPVPPEIQRQSFYFLEEVYLSIKKEELSKETAEKAIHYSDAQWYYMNVISEEKPRSNRNVTRETIENIAKKTTHVVVGAYDMEGFVVWVAPRRKS